jgi:hypothetical protein
MQVNVVGNPVDIFLDSNGQPLQGGSIYIGQPNTDPTNPANQITLYQDSALSIPFQQPIKTINGQPSLNGTQAVVYLGLGTTAYSLAVLNAGGVVVMSLPNVQPFSLGGSAGGNMVFKEFTAANGDFTPGGSAPVLSLTSNFGSANNVRVDVDGVLQKPGIDYTLNGTTLSFTAPVPVGTQTINTLGGITTPVGTISNGSVLDSSIAPGSKLYNRITDLVDVRDKGAVGNGSTDDSSAFASNVPAYYIPPSTGDYLIATNTTVTADMWFMGGVITVPTGVTLTINGSIIAPSKVLFQGAGTVVINRGIIDVAWFDGTDASSKTAFCLRGVSNTNGTGKTLAYYPPQPNDAWATQSPNSQWGYGWKVAAPIRLEQQQNYTRYMTYAGFVATAAMDAVFTLGYAGVAGAPAVLKADGQIFPIQLKVDGGNGLANWAVRIYGSSHSNFPDVQAYYCGGIAFTPAGQMQCSDINVGFLDTGSLFNQAILMDGTTGANNTITDIEIGFVNSTGFTNGHAADSVVKIGSNTNGISVRKVAHRAVVSGVGGAFQDATQAVVLITNGGTLGSNVVSPRYGINIGPVINGSATITAEAIVVSDASSGTAAKMTGITIESGSEVDTGTPPGNSSISLNYTSGAIVQGLPSSSSTNTAQKVTVNSTCVGTMIYGATPSQVVDGGVGTLINGHNYGAITAASVGASPVSYTNPFAYDVDYEIQGGTVTSVNITRGSTTVSAYSGSSLNAGLFRLSPGDQIQYAYSSVPTANIVPR